MTVTTRTALVALLGALVACGPNTSAPADDLTDTAAQVDTVADADEDAQADVPFIIGVNATGIEDTSLFRPLEDGGDLEIELGFQGLWMVVLAFKTQGLVEGLVTLFARVRTATDVLGEFGIAKQVLIRADDGFDYYLNLFLIVDSVEHAGKEAWVDLEAEDSDGDKVGGTVQVMLTSVDIPDTFTPPVLFPDSSWDEDDADVGPVIDTVDMDAEVQADPMGVEVQADPMDAEVQTE